MPEIRDDILFMVQAWCQLYKQSVSKCCTLSLFFFAVHLFMLESICRMDSMVITEATRHGMLINEVSGTRSVVANLEGVIFEITLC